MEGLKFPESGPAFTPAELAEIEAKRKLLSSLAYFIGKDFEIPVLLNEPGAGWLPDAGWLNVNAASADGSYAFLGCRPSRQFS